MATSTPEPRNLPAWAIAAILLLLLLGVGWALWSHARSSDPDVIGPLTDVQAIGPAAPRVGRGGRGGGPNGWQRLANNIVQNGPDGVQVVGNMYIVRAGEARAMIDRRNGPDWRYRFSYANANLVSPDDRATLQVAQDLTRDTTKAKADGVTPQQVEQLKSTVGNPNPGMLVDPPDRAQISQLFLAWLDAAGGPPTTAPSTRPSSPGGPITLNASKSAPGGTAKSPQAVAAEQKLVAALDALGKRQLEPTRQNSAKRVAEVQRILGAQLLQKLKQGG